jgi:hypothetical protein
LSWGGHAARYLGKDVPESDNSLDGILKAKRARLAAEGKIGNGKEMENEADGAVEIPVLDLSPNEPAMCAS